MVLKRYFDPNAMFCAWCFLTIDMELYVISIICVNNLCICKYKTDIQTNSRESAFMDLNSLRGGYILHAHSFDTSWFKNLLGSLLAESSPHFK